MNRLLFVCIALVGLVGIATRAGLITGNVSPSAPVGVYIRSEPSNAEYVTFCLAERHSTRLFFQRFCSPTAPHKIKILKRISERRTGGSLVVQGIAPGSIDSKLIGLVQPEQVYGYWRRVSL